MPDKPGVRHLLMTGDTVGGVWSYALELARGLGARGVTITLVTFGRLPSAAQVAEARRIASLDLRPTEFKLEWMDDPWGDVQAAGELLLDLEAELRPDAVHLGGYAHAALPFRAPAIVVAHSCVLSWWRAVHGTDAPSGWDRYRVEVARGLRAAAAVVAPTAAMLAALSDEHGPFARARTIWNGRDPAAFTPEPKRPFILAVGRLWDEAKNLAALDVVAPRLVWPVVVAGDLGDAATENVHQIGRLPLAGVAELMARASIFALPARYEPFGLAPLEAALAGCALVLGDIPSLREVWGDTVRYVQPDDHDALAATLAELIGDGDERARLAEAARARAATFTPARMAAQYLDVYGAIRAGRNRGEDACA
jgi:glycosyltransferase involved in cell wall biosynthesis